MWLFRIAKHGFAVLKSTTLVADRAVAAEERQQRRLVREGG